MDRIIGIDYGKKRTGLAVSDPLCIFASAIETIDSTKIIEYIQKYSEKETIKEFVIGYPLNLNGQLSENALYVDKFLKILKNKFPDIPIILEDERFTSVIAHRAMIDGGMKYMERRKKSNVDKISACIILQGYLDRRAGNKAEFNLDKSII